MSGVLEGIYGLGNSAPSFVQADQNTLYRNVTWLNIYVVLVILVFIFTWAFGMSRFTNDRFYDGNTSANTGFNAVRDNFAVDSSDLLMYEFGCDDISREWNFVYEVVRMDNPNIDQDPMFPAWAVLYKNYIRLKKAVDNGDLFRKDDMLGAWNAILTYQQMNNYNPLKNQTQFTKAMIQSQQETVAMYTEAAKKGFVKPEGFSNRTVVFNTKSNLKRPLLVRDRFTAGISAAAARAEAPTARDSFAVAPKISLTNFPDPKSSTVTVIGAKQGGQVDDDGYYQIMNGENFPNGLAN